MLKAGLTVSDEELAIICASHSGSAAHIELVSNMLAKRDISLDLLQNAPDKPLGEKEKIAWGDKNSSQLAQNCSGKHAGMLITCSENNWDLQSYLKLDLRLSC
jgi:L-asparaginase II